MDTLFLTKTGLGRIANIDVRSRRLVELFGQPDGYLVLGGTRKIPLFKLARLDSHPQVQARKKLTITNS